MEKLKRVIIKEEFVALTGCYKKAITLNQMIYWCERVKDFDKFIEEENERSQKFIEKQHGWIYKKADELSKETLMNISRPTMLKLLESLVSLGFLDKRRNPKYKWDKTFQYRANLILISQELNKIGYELQGFKKLNHEVKKLNHESIKTLPRINKNLTAIPETTTETTPKSSETSVSHKKKLINDPIIEHLLYLTKRYLKQDIILSENQCKPLFGIVKSQKADIIEKAFKQAAKEKTRYTFASLIYGAKGASNIASLSAKYSETAKPKPQADDFADFEKDMADLK